MKITKESIKKIKVLQDGDLLVKLLGNYTTKNGKRKQTSGK